MGLTGISWTGTRLREPLKIYRDIRIDNDLFLGWGLYPVGDVVEFGPEHVADINREPK